MIQVHSKTILSMEFKSMIKAHDLNPWQFIYPKAQFSLAKSKPNSHWQYQSPILIGAILSKKSPRLSILGKEKNIMVKYYHGKNHGNRLIKKLIGSYLENYVLIL